MQHRNWLELHYNEIGVQYLLLKKTQPVELNMHPKYIKDSFVYHDEPVQTDLTAEQITRMGQAHSKLQDELKRDLCMEECNEMTVQSGFVLA